MSVSKQVVKRKDEHQQAAMCEKYRGWEDHWKISGNISIHVQQVMCEMYRGCEDHWKISWDLGDEHCIIQFLHKLHTKQKSKRPRSESRKAKDFALKAENSKFQADKPKILLWKQKSQRSRSEIIVYCRHFDQAA